MKTRTKKLSALLLTTAMAVSVAACGNNDTGISDEQESKAESSVVADSDASVASSSEVEEKLYYNMEGFPIVDEPITIEVAGIQGTTKDWQNTFTVQKIEEMMGIKMNCTTYADKTVWATQYATMLASDTLPDLMISLSVDKATTNLNGEEGYLLDLSDYLDIMPNFAKFLEENPEYAAFSKAADGSIYSLDRVRPVATPLHCLYVSKADQEKYGFSVDDIKTTEDFYNVLKSIKEQNPDAIPLSLTLSGQSGQRGMWTIRAAYGIFSSEQSPIFGVDEQGNLYLDDISDNNRAYLAYMNSLWEEGLLDEEAYIMTSAEYQSKISNGDVVFWHDWSYIPAGTGKDSSVYAEYDALTVLTSEYNEVPTYVHFAPYNSAARVMVSADTEYPEAICRLIDYMFSEEGNIFINYGVEGETFDWVDDGFGNKVINSDNYWDKETYTSVADWRNQEVIIVNGMSLIMPSETRIVADNASDADLEKFIFEDEKYTYTQDAFHEKYIRAQAEVERYPSYMAVTLTTEEAEKSSQIMTDMNLLLQQFRAEFITGDKSTETDWDSYVKEIKALWDQIQPYYQAAQDRFAANK